jgi:hypothetical protein
MKDSRHSYGMFACSRIWEEICKTRVKVALLGQHGFTFWRRVATNWLLQIGAEWSTGPHFQIPSQNRLREMCILVVFNIFQVLALFTSFSAPKNRCLCGFTCDTPSRTSTAPLGSPAYTTPPGGRAGRRWRGNAHAPPSPRADRARTSAPAAPSGRQGHAQKPQGRTAGRHVM